MISFALIMAGISLAIAFWIGQQIVANAMSKYKAVFMHDTHIGLREIFVFIDITHLWPALICLGMGVAFMTWFIFDSLVLCTILATSTLVIPRLALARAIRNRLGALERQLPDALLAISSALRAGASLGNALRQITQDAEAPLSQEFGLMLREQRLGIPLSVALTNLHLRMPCESVQMTTTLMRIATLSGGSLASLLETLSETIRARLHIHMKVDVLTSQGKMQAWIVGALPFALLAVLSVIDPTSIQLLLHTAIGQGVLAIILLLEAAGIYLLNRILAIQV
jgi:tight adherence protein B